MIIGTSSRVRLPRWLRRLSKNYAVVPALVFLAALVLVAIFAPYLAPHDADQGAIAKRLLPPVWQEGGSTEHLLGTDALGRDILSRLLLGARVSLVVGLFGTLFGAVFGVTVGLLAGYRGGWIDDALMRLADVQLAFPFILLAIALLVVLGAGI
ncbi:MAG: ABC transporter permease subunit, partial [Trueperaceae bacterium]